MSKEVSIASPFVYFLSERQHDRVGVVENDPADAVDEVLIFGNAEVVHVPVVIYFLDDRILTAAVVLTRPNRVAPFVFPVF